MRILRDVLQSGIPPRRALLLLAVGVAAVSVALARGVVREALCAALACKPVARTPTVHMLSGLIASGKSTFADELRAQLDVPVFSPDEWILRLYGKDFPVERFGEVGDTVKGLIWDMARELLVRGYDVVLDFSFWQRADRQLWRDKIAASGFVSQLYYMSCRPEQCRQRLLARNANRRPGDFVVAIDTFDSWVPLYEVPGADENATVVPCNFK